MPWLCFLDDVARCGFVRLQAIPLIETRNLEALADPRLGRKYPPEGLLLLAEVAKACVHPIGDGRPDMAEVARRLAEVQDSLQRTSLRQAGRVGSEIQSEGGDVHTPIPLMVVGSGSSSHSYDSRAVYEPMSGIMSGR